MRLFTVICLMMKMANDGHMANIHTSPPFPLPRCNYQTCAEGACICVLEAKPNLVESIVFREKCSNCDLSVRDEQHSLGWSMCSICLHCFCQGQNVIHMQSQNTVITYCMGVTSPRVWPYLSLDKNTACLSKSHRHTAFACQRRPAYFCQSTAGFVCHREGSACVPCHTRTACVCHDKVSTCL
jgi:hypothetical protein